MKNENPAGRSRTVDPARDGLVLLTGFEMYNDDDKNRRRRRTRENDSVEQKSAQSRFAIL